MDNNSNFRINRVKQIKEMYANEVSRRNKQKERSAPASLNAKNAAEVRDLMTRAISDRSKVVDASEKLYASNPIYQAVIDYMSNMYLWRYKVIPHQSYKRSRAKLRKTMKPDDYNLYYRQMVEVVDGLNIETKFPKMLTQLYTNGAVYFTTIGDTDDYTLETVLLPDAYCKKIGETQYGTSIIAFDFAFFDKLSLNLNDTVKYLKESFTKEFADGYKKYKKDPTQNWIVLDPRFSSALLLNDYSIPTYFYLYGGILDYEKYQDNELERNENLLKYIVVQTMPHYEDKLLFEMDEVAELHRSMRNIIDKGDKVRLLTTYGDLQVLKISENDTTANEVLVKAYEAIFHNAGFNSGLFSGDSVTALNLSLIRDKGRVWKYVQGLTNFYTIAINNWFDFKNLEANIEILSISPYTYSDDISIYKENATLGVGKLDYLIASGIKQKNIQDQLELEKFLKLEDITPMQTSYTQTADDRGANERSSSSEEKNSSESEIEPKDKDDKTSTEKRLED